jgi:hypothetical protein
LRSENRSKKRRTDRPRIDGLAVFDLDVSDVEGRQKGKEVIVRIECVLALESVGKNADPKNGGTGNLSVSDDDEASDIDGRPADLVRVHEIAELGTQVWPHDVQLVAEDGADLLQLAVIEASGLRSRRLDPHLPRTVHERSTTWPPPWEITYGGE